MLALVVLRFLYFFLLLPVFAASALSSFIYHIARAPYCFPQFKFLIWHFEILFFEKSKIVFFFSFNLNANVFKVYETSVVSIVENTLLRVRTGLWFRSDRDKRMNNCPDSDSNGKIILNSFQLATEFYQWIYRIRTLFLFFVFLVVR